MKRRIPEKPVRYARKSEPLTVKCREVQCSRSVLPANENRCGGYWGGGRYGCGRIFCDHDLYLPLRHPEAGSFCADCVERVETVL